MVKPERFRDAADAVLSAGSMRESIASIRSSIGQLLGEDGCLDGLDSGEAFRVAWTVAATAGALITGVTALLRSFDGLAPEELLEETRQLVARLGANIDGSPAELLADRDEVLAELESRLDLLGTAIRESAAQAPGALLADSDFAALLG